jgi:hypothetical protein
MKIYTHTHTAACPLGVLEPFFIERQGVRRKKKKKNAAFLHVRE